MTGFRVVGQTGFPIPEGPRQCPVAARRRSDSNNGQFNDLAIPTS